MGYRCAVCGGHGDNVHEMTNGPYRMLAFGRREAWLNTCSICNCDVLTDKKLWPLAEQLRLKLVTDPTYFNLDVINEILAPVGRVIQRITAADVLATIVADNIRGLSTLGRIFHG